MSYDDYADYRGGIPRTRRRRISKKVEKWRIKTDPILLSPKLQAQHNLATSLFQKSSDSIDMALEKVSKILDREGIIAQNRLGYRCYAEELWKKWSKFGGLTLQKDGIATARGWYFKDLDEDILREIAVLFGINLPTPLVGVGAPPSITEHGDLSDLFIADHVDDWRNVRDFNSIQDAHDDLNGNGEIIVPAGVFNENVVIDKPKVVLRGCGLGSHINGGESHALTIEDTDCTIKDLTLSTPAGGGHGAYVIYDKFNYRGKYFNLYIPESDNRGIYVETGHYPRWFVDCIVRDCDNMAMWVLTKYTKVIGCHFFDNSADAVGASSTGDGLMVWGSSIFNNGGDGIYIDAGAENCVIVANRVADNAGIDIDDLSGTSTVGLNDTDPL